ncbi:MAG: GlxA family transcriptional regulator [Rhizobiaceae bacterium]|nr:GlxA family transcriptional regulator [Rhizobiaceae bacterium]
MSNDPTFREFTIGMLLFDGFNSLAMHAFIDPFRSANYLRGESLYRWEFIGFEADCVTASNGLTISSLKTHPDISEPLDLLVVNASWGVSHLKSPKLLSWLRDQSSRGVTLCGLDTGAFILAFAGLLKGRRAAVHYEHIAAFRELFPDVAMGEEMFIVDGDRLTCSGGLASSDLALEIIRLQQGMELANASGRYIFHERLRNGDEGQLSEHQEPVGYAAPEKLREAIILMERTLEQPLDIGEVAKTVGISQRQLDRLFNKHTGVSPVRYYLDVRLDRARGLVTQTELPILTVAVACGFSSNAQFSRTYRKRFGISPSQDRIEGRVPFQFRSFPSHAGV